jgi:hypothetical protein
VWQFSFARYQSLAVNGLEPIGVELPRPHGGKSVEFWGEDMNSPTKTRPMGIIERVVSGVRI